MIFASFKERFLATMIDSLIFIPLTGAILALDIYSKFTASLWLNTFVQFLYPVYVISFLWRFGWTPGKRFQKIIVVKDDGSKIGFREAFLRHSVDVALNALAVFTLWYAVSRISPIELSSADWSQRNVLINNATPTLATWTNTILMFWGLSELVVMLLNKRRKALHDYIAGTVVVRSGSS